MAPVPRPAGMYAGRRCFVTGSWCRAAADSRSLPTPSRWNRVPLLAGTNRDEMKLFLALGGAHQAPLRPLPAAAGRATLQRCSVGLHSDSWKAVGVDLPLAIIMPQTRPCPCLPTASTGTTCATTGCGPADAARRCARAGAGFPVRAADRSRGARGFPRAAIVTAPRSWAAACATTGRALPTAASRQWPQRHADRLAALARMRLWSCSSMRR
jgi:hypothetical protein